MYSSHLYIWMFLDPRKEISSDDSPSSNLCQHLISLSQRLPQTKKPKELTIFAAVWRAAALGLATDALAGLCRAVASLADAWAAAPLPARAHVAALAVGSTLAVWKEKDRCYQNFKTSDIPVLVQVSGITNGDYTQVTGVPGAELVVSLMLSLRGLIWSWHTRAADPLHVVWSPHFYTFKYSVCTKASCAKCGGGHTPCAESALITLAPC